MWLCAIANAIESCINGTSTVRTFDTSKLRTSSGALDDHALPAARHKPLGLGFPLPPIPQTPGNRRSMPPLSRNGSGSAYFMRDREGEREKRARKTSFKNVLKQSGEKWTSVMNGVTNRNSASFDLPRPGSMVYTNGNGNGDMGPPESPLPPIVIPKDVNSVNDNHVQTGRTTPPPNAGSGISMSTSPSSRSVRESWDGYDDSHDTAIEQRVFAMAGLGLGDSPRSSSLARRVQSDTGAKHLEAGSEMSRSRSADVPRKEKEPEMTMKLLRELADSPHNARCADCKKLTKASQWATLSMLSLFLPVFTLMNRSTGGSDGHVPLYTMLWTPQRFGDTYIQTEGYQSRSLVPRFHRFGI
jgi:hypothetical protein